jgi:hypothetical protein
VFRAIATGLTPIAAYAGPCPHAIDVSQDAGKIGSRALEFGSAFRVAGGGRIRFLHKVFGRVEVVCQCVSKLAQPAPILAQRGNAGFADLLRALLFTALHPNVEV